MKFYESMVIVDPKAPEEEVEKLIKKVEKVVAKDGGGEIKKVTKQGVRRLAYPINHQKEGLYYLLNLEIDPLSIKEYESVLKLSNIVMRFLTQKLTPPPQEPEVKEVKEEEKKEKIKEEDK